MRALLRSFEERVDGQHQQLVGKIERLEKRMDAAIAKGQAEARLLASRFEQDKTASGRHAPARCARPAARARAGGAFSAADRRDDSHRQHRGIGRVQRVRAPGVHAGMRVQSVSAQRDRTGRAGNPRRLRALPSLRRRLRAACGRWVNGSGSWSSISRKRSAACQSMGSAAPRCWVHAGSVKRSVSSCERARSSRCSPARFRVRRTGSTCRSCCAIDSRSRRTSRSSGRC